MNKVIKFADESCIKCTLILNHQLGKTTNALSAALNYRDSNERIKKVAKDLYKNLKIDPFDVELRDKNSYHWTSVDGSEIISFDKVSASYFMHKFPSENTTFIQSDLIKKLSIFLSELQKLRIDCSTALSTEYFTKFDFFSNPDYLPEFLLNNSLKSPFGIKFDVDFLDNEEKAFINLNINNLLRRKAEDNYGTLISFTIMPHETMVSLDKLFELNNKWLSKIIPENLIKGDANE